MSKPLPAYNNWLLTVIGTNFCLGISTKPFITATSLIEKTFSIPNFPSLVYKSLRCGWTEYSLRISLPTTLYFVFLAPTEIFGFCCSIGSGRYPAQKVGGWGFGTTIPWKILMDVDVAAPAPIG